MFPISYANAKALLIEPKSSMAELDEVLRPIREAFDASGMTEDELSDLLEEEKHAMRRGE